jgi:hypothetical protein
VIQVDGASTDITISNVRVDTGYAGVWIQQGSRLRILNSFFTDCTHNIYVGHNQAGQGGAIEDLVIMGNDSSTSATDANGLKAIKKVKGFSIIGNTFHDNYADGIDLFVSGEEVAVIGNVISDNGVTGMDIKSNEATYSIAEWGKGRNMVIANNIVRSNDAQGIKLARVSASTAALTEYPYLVTIEGNDIIDNTADGLYIESPYVTVKNNLIAGNGVTDGNNYRGIYVYGNPSYFLQSMIVLEGNVIINNGNTSETNYGLGFSGTSKAVVTNNIFDNDDNYASANTQDGGITVNNACYPSYCSVNTGTQCYDEWDCPQTGLCTGDGSTVCYDDSDCSGVGGTCNGDEDCDPSTCDEDIYIAFNIFGSGLTTTISDSGDVTDQFQNIGHNDNGQGISGMWSRETVTVDGQYGDIKLMGGTGYGHQISFSRNSANFFRATATSGAPSFRFYFDNNSTGNTTIIDETGMEASALNDVRTIGTNWRVGASFDDRLEEAETECSTNECPLWVDPTDDETGELDIRSWGDRTSVIDWRDCGWFADNSAWYECTDTNKSWKGLGLSFTLGDPNTDETQTNSIGLAVHGYHGPTGENFFQRCSHDETLDCSSGTPTPDDWCDAQSTGSYCMEAKDQMSAMRTYYNSIGEGEDVGHRISVRKSGRGDTYALWTRSVCAGVTNLDNGDEGCGGISVRRTHDAAVPTGTVSTYSSNELTWSSPSRTDSVGIDRWVIRTDDFQQECFTGTCLAEDGQLYDSTNASSDAYQTTALSYEAGGYGHVECNTAGGTCDWADDLCGGTSCNWQGDPQYCLMFHADEIDGTCEHTPRWAGVCDDDSDGLPDSGGTVCLDDGDCTGTCMGQDDCTQSAFADPMRLVFPIASVTDSNSLIIDTYSGPDGATKAYWGSGTGDVYDSSDTLICDGGECEYTIFNCSQATDITFADNETGFSPDGSMTLTGYDDWESSDTWEMTQGFLYGKGILNLYHQYLPMPGGSTLAAFQNNAVSENRQTAKIDRLFSGEGWADYGLYMGGSSNRYDSAGIALGDTRVGLLFENFNTGDEYHNIAQGLGSTIRWYWNDGGTTRTTDLYGTNDSDTIVMYFYDTDGDPGIIRFYGSENDGNQGGQIVVNGTRHGSQNWAFTQYALFANNYTDNGFWGRYPAATTPTSDTYIFRWGGTTVWEEGIIDASADEFVHAYQNGNVLKGFDTTFANGDELWTIDPSTGEFFQDVDDDGSADDKVTAPIVEAAGCGSAPSYFAWCRDTTSNPNTLYVAMQGTGGSWVWVSVVTAP